MQDVTDYPTVLNITLKNDTQSYKEKHLIYEPYYLHPQNPTIQEIIIQAKEACSFEPSQIKIRTAMEIT